MKHSSVAIPDEILNLLRARYNILGLWSFFDFDYDFTILRDRLFAIKKEQFDPHDRIVIEHEDTDFYIKECSVGINVRNFFCVVRELDLPLYLFVFYTNHFGLQKEFDILCGSSNMNDRPTVIESFLTTAHHDKKRIMPVDCNFQHIEFNMLCMMNLIRSHRHAVYNALKDVDNQKLALAGTNDNL